MKTFIDGSNKIQAAKLATANGVTMLIVNGATVGNLRRALSGEVVGTIFPAKNSLGGSA